MFGIYKKNFRNAEISQKIATDICNISKKNIRIMEVCGTHTVSIFRNGIRSFLPPTIELCSGPGCPVCVTDQKQIDVFVNIAGYDDVIITTFGDLIRVPGTRMSLGGMKSDGADIRVVYSAFDALDIAIKNSDKNVVFLGIGFETTAPTVAATIISAKQMGIKNFYVVSAHKIVPPALEVLVNVDQINIDGFILPGHVSVMIGSNAYRSFFDKYNIPSVIAGFEPTDLLGSILMIVKQIEIGVAKLENGYSRVVTVDGNLKAMNLLGEVFEIVDTNWRGMGTIVNSGLVLRDKYSMYDAEKFFDIKCDEKVFDNDKCICSDIIIGVKTPPECDFYKVVCNPTSPIGPCMVSNEGTCAVYYRYYR